MYVPVSTAAWAASPGLRNDVDEEKDTVIIQRKNTDPRHEKGISHITHELREAASRSNAVDEALHEFVSAKFCYRLKEVEVLNHPLVVNELASFQLLDERLEQETESYTN